MTESAGSAGAVALAEPAWWPPDQALAPEPVLPADPFEGWEPVLPDEPAGRTITINLGPLCRQHHNAKTHGRWRLSYDPRTSTTTWVSPLSRTYTKGTDPPLT